MQQRNVGIWIRVSTDMQVKDESPEHHERRARSYADLKNWNVAEVYKLDAVSGKSVMDHPETKRMLKDIKSGHISGLIFSKLARLARNTKELLEFSDLFKESGADLISLAESIDTSSPAGRLFYTMIAAMATWEREEIAERVAASVPIRAKMGKPLGGQASFGYKWEANSLALDQKEAPIRKLIHELFLKHKRKKTVAKELNSMGHRTRNGGEFSDTTIGRLLRDSTAKGIRIANYSKSLGNKKNWVLKPEEEWISFPCPAIVTEELWNECNTELDRQEQKRKPGPKTVHLLSGFVYCTCGKKMYVYHENNPTYRCKTCKTSIPSSDLEEIYYSQLRSFLLTDKDVNHVISQSDNSIKEKETLLKNVQNNQDDIKKKMDYYLELRVNSELTKEEFAEKRKPLQIRLAQIEDQIPQLEAEIDFLKIQQMSADTVLTEARNLYDRWPTLPFEEKRNIVEVITDTLTISKSDIHISLAYTPTPNTTPSLPNHGNRQRNFMGS